MPMLPSVMTKTSLTIQDIDDQLTAALRIRAAQHHRSIESEVLDILRHALSTAAQDNAATDGLGTRMARLFADLDEPFEPSPRTGWPRAAEFPE